MDLELTYIKIKNIIEKIDFSQLWKGFKPLKFALYNENECFFDGKYIEKTDEFIANTSINYNDEYIAIWNISGNEDIEILASKIIHEMFHAFQNINNESRFPNEIEAIYKYSYTTENLSIKNEENLIIASLIKNFNEEDYQKLLQYRRYRYSHFKYEFDYEVSVEQIEGTACFVELNALKQISKEKYKFSLNKMLEEICDYKNLFPIRIISYSIGALFFKLLKDNHLADFEFFDDEPTSITFIKNVKKIKCSISNNQIEKMIKDYNQETSLIINNALSNGRCIIEGEYNLLGLDVYDTRYYNSFIVSNYFVMYEYNGITEVKYSDYNFVIELNKNKKIIKILEI